VYEYTCLSEQSSLRVSQLFRQYLIVPHNHSRIQSSSFNSAKPSTPTHDTRKLLHRPATTAPTSLHPPYPSKTTNQNGPTSERTPRNPPRLPQRREASPLHPPPTPAHYLAKHLTPLVFASQFINRCTKPDRREFIKISQAVGIGFLIMGARMFPSPSYNLAVDNKQLMIFR